jgi:hypothetical protein
MDFILAACNEQESVSHTCNGFKSPLKLKNTFEVRTVNNVRKRSYRYNAACEGNVFSSRMASGFRFGGVLAADAAPRSTPPTVIVSASTLFHRYTYQLTSAGPFATKAAGTTTDQRCLVLKYHLARALIQGVHNDGHRCCFAFIKDLT